MKDKRSKYTKLWFVFANIKARKGSVFNDLIDVEDDERKRNLKYAGAWANILIKSDTINHALEIVPLGLKELGFDIVFVDKVENVSSLIEEKKLTSSVLAEAEWLLKSKFVFKISDKLFPYVKE